MSSGSACSATSACVPATCPRTDPAAPPTAPGACSSAHSARAVGCSPTCRAVFAHGISFIESGLAAQDVAALGSARAFLARFP